MNAIQSETMRSEIAQKMSLDIVRYSQVWEDYSVLCHGLEISEGDEVLSIASSGCNVFAMLLAGAKSVTAIDMSPAQIALVELKIEAIKALSYEQFLAFVGVRNEPTHRLITYQMIRPSLSPRSREFWDAHEDSIEKGIINIGLFDRYLRLFLETKISQLWPKEAVEALLGAKTIAEQQHMYQSLCNTEEFRQAFVHHASQEIISLFGRDPAQFKYAVTTDLGQHFFARFEHALMQVSNIGNFYMEYCLVGKYRNPEQGPPYLRRDNFQRLKSLVDRIHLVTEELEVYLSRAKDRQFNKVNLSDVFEYMSEADADELFSLLSKRIATKGRLAYWTLLVPRQPQQALNQQLCFLQDKSELLHRFDRTWFYNSFNIYEVH